MVTKLCLTHMKAIPLLALATLLPVFADTHASEEDNRNHVLSVRASVINPLAREHPEIKFTFAEDRLHVSDEISLGKYGCRNRLTGTSVQLSNPVPQ